MPAFTSNATLFAAAFLLLLACWHDLATRMLPDGLALALAGLGVAARVLAGDLGAGLLAAGLVLLLLLLPWRLGALGGGDVKLLGACALLAGPGGVPDLVVATAIAGGVLALPYLVARRWPPALPAPARGLAARVRRAELRRLGRGGPLPYGLAIAAGTLITLADRG